MFSHGPGIFTKLLDEYIKAENCAARFTFFYCAILLLQNCFDIDCSCDLSPLSTILASGDIPELAHSTVRGLGKIKQLEEAGPDLVSRGNVLIY